MKKIVNVFFVMTLLLGGWGLSSCDEAGAIQGGEDIEQEEGKDNNGDADDDDDIPEPVIKGIALYPSSPLIVADGTDTLALTVKFDGVDVTESAIIYMNSKRMEGNLFATEVTKARFLMRLRLMQSALHSMWSSLKTQRQINFQISNVRCWLPRVQVHGAVIAPI